MTARHPKWRSARRIALAGALLIAALAYGNHRWQQLLHAQGIEHLSWQGLHFSLSGPTLQRLQLEQRQATGSRLQIAAEHLRLDWPTHDDQGWHLPRLRIADLKVDWQASSSSGSPPVPHSPDLHILAALPRHLAIDTFDTWLPCASGRCLLQGSLQASHTGAQLLPAHLELRLRHEGQRLTLHADLDGQPDLQELALQTRVLFNEEQRIRLSSTLKTLKDNGTKQVWRGELAMPGLPEAPWLQDWLGQWLGPWPADATPSLQAMRLEADWQLQWPQGPLELQRLSKMAQGEARIHAQVPEPWPVPGFGLLQGNLNLKLAGNAGDWLPRQVQADLRLTRPQGTWLEGIPEPLRPETLQLQIAPRPVNALSDAPHLPLSLQLRSQGQARTLLQCELDITPQLPDWRLELKAGRIELDVPRLQLADSRLERLNVRLQMTGQLDRERLQLTLEKESRFNLEQLGLAELRLAGLKGQLAGLRLAAEHSGGALRALQLSGPLRLQTAHLLHPRLQAQGWRWQGRLDAAGVRQRLAGTLQSEQGLAMSLQLQRSSDGALAMDAQLTEILLHAGNPLAATLIDWPARLDLDKGRLQGRARLRLRPGAPLLAELELQPQDLSGIYDRSELHGLSGRLQARLRGSQLELQLTELEVAHLNPGLPLGPLRLRGQYSTSLAQPLRGQLAWQQAELALLGGRAWLSPSNQDLSTGSASFSVRLEGLQLGELFRLYPAEGLAGQGTLNGRLPLLTGPAGVRIEQGRLENSGPGILQFRSERIRTLARTNPAMKLVAEALEDFHFSQLSSDLGYDEQGTLHMVLRLEGRNPTLEKGRPIHFNINLEEDIPALLTSLQLTDRVSERIRQRVQQRLQQDPDAH
ncbi:YdbH domain-containing protein [Azotobacter salinestris]|uniref:YdbH domain-containing protein n=1 Tax=Azotobacter salinestris TaxID=69964 RepID=UPI0032DF5A61